MGELTELGRYVLDLINEQNLSLREASMKAGLAPETISQMLRRGKTSTPRPDTLRMIADALGGDYRRMMELAGHLPSGPITPLVDVPQLRNFAERVSKLPPERQRRIMEAALLLLEIDEGGSNVPKEKILS